MHSYFNILTEPTVLHDPSFVPVSVTAAVNPYSHIPHTFAQHSATSTRAQGDEGGRHWQMRRCRSTEVTSLAPHRVSATNAITPTRFRRVRDEQDWSAPSQTSPALTSSEPKPKIQGKLLKSKQSRTRLWGHHRREESNSTVIDDSYDRESSQSEPNTADTDTPSANKLGDERSNHLQTQSDRSTKVTSLSPPRVSTTKVITPTIVRRLRDEQDWTTPLKAHRAKFSLWGHIRREEKNSTTTNDLYNRKLRNSGPIIANTHTPLVSELGGEGSNRLQTRRVRSTNVKGLIPRQVSATGAPFQASATSKSSTRPPWFRGPLSVNLSLGVHKPRPKIRPHHSCEEKNSTSTEDFYDQELSKSKPVIADSFTLEANELGDGSIDHLKLQKDRSVNVTGLTPSQASFTATSSMPVVTPEGTATRFHKFRSGLWDHHRREVKNSIVTNDLYDQEPSQSGPVIANTDTLSANELGDEGGEHLQMRRERPMRVVGLIPPRVSATNASSQMLSTLTSSTKIVKPVGYASRSKQSRPSLWGHHRREEENSTATNNFYDRESSKSEPFIGDDDTPSANELSQSLQLIDIARWTATTAPSTIHSAQASGINDVVQSANERSRIHLVTLPTAAAPIGMHKPGKSLWGRGVSDSPTRHRLTTLQTELRRPAATATSRSFILSLHKGRLNTQTELPTH
jgi:hypothetical protein